MVKKRYFILCLLCCSYAWGIAQKPAALRKNALEQFENGRWAAAHQLFTAYQAAKPGDLDVLTKLGICSYHLGMGDQALKLLEYAAAKNPAGKDYNLYYYLARTLHGLQEYERAIPAYKAFLRFCPKDHPFKAGIADQLRRCMSGLAVKTNETVALVENLGDRINSAGDEFAPLFSPNHPERFYYAAARENCQGGLRNDEGYEDTLSGHWCSDMFIASLSAAGWETRGDLGSLINTPRFEAPVSFSQNGKVLYYFRGFTMFSGEILADTAGRKDEYAVQAPLLKSPMQAEAGDEAAFFYNDTTMIFASRRSGGLGGLDLYVTTLRAEGWTEPVNLGDKINSPYDETTPFVAPDGHSLYFSSNRTSSIGGLDVFKTRYEPAVKSWSAPENVGTPINSPFDDGYFQCAADGRTAMLASGRFGGYGMRDVYIVYFKESLPEYKVEQAEKFAGIPEPALAQESTIPVFSAQPLFYDNDRDLTTGDNVKAIQQAILICRQYPDVMVIAHAHTDETGPLKFDLYNGIKRAEIVGKTLENAGIDPARIILRSTGPAYALARMVVDAAPSPEGRRLNRRIDIEFVGKDGKLPFEWRIDRPVLSDKLASGAWKVLEDYKTGLAYKVEFAQTRQILNSDAAAMFSDLMIEKDAFNGAFRYTAGWFRQFQQALPLKADLLKQGFSDVQVIAYLNGIRISKADAVALLKKYPDLNGFIRG